MKSLCVEAKIVEYILLFGSNSAYPYILLEVMEFYTVIWAPPSGYSNYIFWPEGN